MTEEGAFLRAILQEPDDDTHRLVYADWLDEHGDAARAEFIRVQVERARLEEYDPRQYDLAEREHPLLTEHAVAWTRELRPLVRRCGFRRGFVEEITLDARQLIEHAGRIFGLAPVRHICLHSIDALARSRLAVERVAGLAAYSDRWHTLDLSLQYIRDEGLAYLLDCRHHLHGLTSLGLRSNSLSAHGVAALAHSPLLGQLDALDLSSNSAIGLESLSRLLDSPQAARLTRLRLSACALGNAGARLLGRAAQFPPLRALGLGHNGITASGSSSFSAGSLARGLEELDLSFNALGRAGARALAVAENLEGLKQLNLSHTGLGDAGAQALARGPLLGRLVALDLSLNRIGDQGAHALAHYPHPARLRRLDLIYNPIGPEAMEALAQRFGDRVCVFHR